ncbi:unnamed protein product [Jaminaea pallidilutea]
MGSEKVWGADQYRILAEEAISVVLASRAQIFKRKELAPWTGKGSNLHKRMAHIVEVWKKDFGVGESVAGGAVKAEGASSKGVNKDGEKKNAAAGKSARRTKKEEHSDDDLSSVSDDKSDLKDEHSLAGSGDKNGSSSSSSSKLGLRPQRKTVTKPAYFEDVVGSDDDDEDEGQTEDIKGDVDQGEGSKEVIDKGEQGSKKETVKAATGSKRKAAGRTAAKSASSKRSKA